MDAMVVLALLLGGTAVLGWCGVSMAEEDDAASAILALERGALDRWGHGDPSGFLEISAPEVTYFDPFVPHRLDGLATLSGYYERLRGQVRVDRCELLDPHVAVHDGLAILTYGYRSFQGQVTRQWQCSEIYRKLPEGWRIIHTHWSQPATAR